MSFDEATLKRWRSVEAIFHEVAEAPLEERTARLEALCAGDADLLQEASSLLGARDEEERFTARYVTSGPGESRESVSGGGGGGHFGGANGATPPVVSGGDRRQPGWN